MDKKTARQMVRQSLAALPAAQLAQADAQIVQRLLRLDIYRQAHTILAYASFHETEIDTAPLLRQILRDGKRLCLPLIVGPGLMEARQVEDVALLQRDSYGIPSPTAQMPLCAPDELDLLLVPGLAFDRALWRLGRGAAFYDRYLPACPACKLALARQVQVLEAVPHEAHDIPMDALLTEQEWLCAPGWQQRAGQPD